MNNPLNRRMFRQTGMSKQPMGILASSPELMTTAQKAMMRGKPIKAQSAVSVNTNAANINSPLVNYFRNNPPLQTIKNFATDTADKFMINNEIIADLINKGLLKAGSTLKDVVEKKSPLLNPQNKPDDEKETDEKVSILGTPQNLLSKDFNIQLRKDLKPNKNDSDLLKSTKEVLSGGYNFINEKIGNVENFLDNLLLPKDVLERKQKLDLQDLQKELNQRAKEDPDYFNLSRFAGPQRMSAPEKGGERGLVDPNVMSPADPRFPESFPTPKPDQVLGLSVIDKIKNASKQPQGISTNDADKALGIEDLSFKDRVKARREIISTALGRDVAEKDVRTDLNYNLMMTGLLVAAGQSPDALTNIANGLAAGLAGYGKAKGEATEAKRKEDIAVGLAAVEQVFKEAEAEKTRDKKPETIRTAEYLRENPELIPIIKGIKEKTLSDTELRKSIVVSANRNLFPGQPGISKEEVDRQLKAIKGIANSTNENAIPNLNIISKYNLSDDAKKQYPPGSEFDVGGNKYKVSEDGNTATLMR